MTDSKAWWVKCENIIREGCVPVGETGWERVFLARDYDASEARAEKAEAELAVWLTPLREAFGLVSTLALHRIADPSHPIDWAKGIVKDVHEQQNRIVEEVRKAEAVADAADRHALACRNELEVVSRLRADAEAERDAEQARHLITQRKLAEMWAERDRLAGVVERVKDLHRWLKESGTHANEALNLGHVLAEPVVTQTFGPHGDGSYWQMCGHCLEMIKDKPHGFGKCMERRKSTRRAKVYPQTIYRIDGSSHDDCRKADSDRRKSPTVYFRARDRGKWKQP